MLLVADGSNRLETAWRILLFKRNEVPAALVGMSPKDNGYCHLWAIVSDDMRGLGHLLLGTVKKEMDDMYTKRGPFRYLTWAGEGEEENARCLEVLGFERDMDFDFEDEGGNNWEGYVR